MTNSERCKKYYYANRDKKLLYQKTYTQEHKEDKSKYDKKHRQENKEQYKKMNAEYYQKNKKRVRKQANAYTAAHGEENRARAAAWYKENPERGKANAKVSKHRRRARIAKVGGGFTTANVRDLYASQSASCYYCSTSIEEGYHIEHMVPISKGGSNWIDNICLACVPCNRTKGVKTAEEFMNG